MRISKAYRDGWLGIDPTSSNERYLIEWANGYVASFGESIPKLSDEACSNRSTRNPRQPHPKIHSHIPHAHPDLSDLVGATFYESYLG